MHRTPTQSTTMTFAATVFALLGFCHELDAQTASRDSKVVVRGVVLKPDGSPAAGAAIRGSVFPWPDIRTDYLGRDYVPPTTKSTADANGKFEIEINTKPFGDVDAFSSVWRDFWKRTLIGASLDGFGGTWIEFREVPKGESGVTLKLVGDVPIRGRIINAEGNPIGGTTLELFDIGATPDNDATTWIKQAKSGALPQELYAIASRVVKPRVLNLPRTLTTREDGSFEIHGIGQERIVTIAVHGPEVAYRHLKVVARKMKPVQFTRSNLRGAKYNEAVFGNLFQYVADDGLPVEGTVVDAKTGKPLPGVRVESTSISGLPFPAHGILRTTTDKHGKYRLVGVPHDTGSKLKFVPTESQPYFEQALDVPTKTNGTSMRLDVKLYRGVWISGTVTNRDTQAPVPAARIYYFPTFDNRHTKSLPKFTGNEFDIVRPHRSDKSGKYRFVGLPGPAVVAATCALQANQHGLGYDEVRKLLQSRRSKDKGGTTQDLYSLPGLPPNLDAMRFVDINRQNRTGVDIQVSSLEVAAIDSNLNDGLHIKAVDREGNAVSSTVIVGKDFHHESPNGSHRLKGLVAQRLIIRQDDRRLGNAIELTAADIKKGERTVTLLPTTAIVGQLLYDDEPMPKIHLEARVAGTGIPMVPPTVTDDEGRFRCQVFEGSPWDLFAFGDFGSEFGFRFTVVSHDIAVVGGKPQELGELKLVQDGDEVKFE